MPNACWCFWLEKLIDVLVAITPWTFFKHVDTAWSKYYDLRASMNSSARKRRAGRLPYQLIWGFRCSRLTAFYFLLCVSSILFHYSFIYFYYSSLFATIRLYSLLFVTISHYWFVTIRHYSSLFATIRHYSRLFGRYSGFISSRS